MQLLWLSLATLGLSACCLAAATDDEDAQAVHGSRLRSVLVPVDAGTKMVYSVNMEAIPQESDVTNKVTLQDPSPLTSLLRTAIWNKENDGRLGEGKIVTGNEGIQRRVHTIDESKPRNKRTLCKKCGGGGGRIVYQPIKYTGGGGGCGGEYGCGGGSPHYNTGGGRQCSTCGGNGGRSSYSYSKSSSSSGSWSY